MVLRNSVRLRDSCSECEQAVSVATSTPSQRWRLFAAIARLCKCQGSLAGSETLAAMLVRSEAQDKAKSTELSAETSTRCCAGSGRARSSLLACSSVFQALALAGFSTIRISLVADGSSTRVDQESPPEKTPRRAARAKRELMKRQYLVPEHLQQPPHVRRPVAVALFNIAPELLLR